jgi:hypothetical protein
MNAELETLFRSVVNTHSDIDVPALSDKIVEMLGAARNKAWMLSAQSEEELADIANWLDEHPSDEELAEEGIDPSIRARLDTWLANVRGAETYPCFAPVPPDLVRMLEMVIDDWCEVLSSHVDEFYTHLVCSEG